jgi:serine kinase of HPr protein (carbohydrate metabolism regulator)
LIVYNKPLKEMKVADLVKELGLKVHSGEKGLDKEIEGGYVSDLLSDVMGNADSGMVWVTLQTHKNVMAIASLKDLAAVILVKGLVPDADTAAQSESENIPILGTRQQAFETAGRLYGLIRNPAKKEIQHR